MQQESRGPFSAAQLYWARSMRHMRVRELQYDNLIKFKTQKKAHGDELEAGRLPGKAKYLVEPRGLRLTYM
jgi:hypothetical protein